MLECHYLSPECGSFWWLPFVPLDLLQDKTEESWGIPKLHEGVVEPASSSIIFVCHPEASRRPCQQQGWWQHTPAVLLCALQRRDLLGSHCCPSGGVSSEQSRPHRALMPTLILKAENLAYQNELYVTKCSSALSPHSNSSFPQTSPPLTSDSRLTPLLSSPISNIEAPQGQGSVFSSKPHKQQ